MSNLKKHYFYKKVKVVICLLSFSLGTDTLNHLYFAILCKSSSLVGKEVLKMKIVFSKNFLRENIILLRDLLCKKLLFGPVCKASKQTNNKQDSITNTKYPSPLLDLLLPMQLFYKILNFLSNYNFNLLTF